MTTSSIESRAITHLRSLSRNRVNNVVTADDVQNFLTKINFKGTSNARLSIVRTVLQSPNFVTVGYTKSKRPVARGRTITAWVA